MSAKAASLSAVEKLNKSHDLGQFNSGKASLDDWLKKYALASQGANTAKTYVVHKDNRVVGYYSLAAGSIEVAKATDRMKKGQPQRPIPVILLARLAVDVGEQGQGLGQALLKDALLRSDQAADGIGARAVLVEALDAQARDFYLHYNFEPSPVDALTLMLLMKDIRGNMG